MEQKKEDKEKQRDERRSDEAKRDETGRNETIRPGLKKRMEKQNETKEYGINGNDKL